MLWSEDIANITLWILTLMTLCWLLIVACVVEADRVRHTHGVHDTVRIGNTEPHHETRSAA